MLRGARLLRKMKWGPELSYQVIARKYRPQSFKDLVGQSHVARTLYNGIKAGRIPHGILFNGPRGTGKTSSARIVAKTLLCKNPKDFSPCQTCTSCEDVVLGRHLDLIEIDGASNNGVDNVRELRETVGYRPAAGQYKVYLIDEVHMLSTSAFNALLKTLEEPPEHVIFMFATTEVQKIPATILSRCQRFDLKLLGLKEIKDQMIKICDQEKVPWEDAALWTLAKQAKGSLRDGLTLLDQVLSFGDQKLTETSVRDVLGLSDRALLFQVLSAIALQNKEPLFQTTQEILDGGNDPQIFLEDFLETLRHLMVYQLVGPTGVEKSLPAFEVQELQNISAHLKSPEIQLLFDVTLSHLADLQKAHDPNLAFEMLLYKMFFLPRLVHRSKMSTTHPPFPGPQGTPQNTTTTKPAMSGPQGACPVAPNPTPNQPRATAHNLAPIVPESKTGSGSETMSRKVSVVASQPMSEGASETTSKTAAPAQASRQNQSLGDTPSKELSTNKPSLNRQNTVPPASSLEKPEEHQPKSTKSTVKQEQEASTDVNEVRTTWESFVQGVKSSNGFLGALLEHTSIYKEDSDTITLGLPKKMSFLLDKLQEVKNIERTEKFLQSLWADNRKIDVQLLGTQDAEDNPSPKEKWDRSVAKKKTEQAEAIQNHPLVKKTQAIFNGKITKIINKEGCSNETKKRGEHAVPHSPSQPNANQNEGAARGAVEKGI